MRPLTFTIAALLLAAPALGQPEPEWRAASEEQVLLRPFAYEPQQIRLAAGQPVKLNFVNNSRATLSASAPGFFRAARVRARDAGAVAGGHILLRPGERRTVALVPAPGRYRVRSANVLHRALGMSAQILVE